MGKSQHFYAPSGVKSARYRILGRIRYGRSSYSYDMQELAFTLDSKYPNTRVATLQLALGKMEHLLHTANFDYAWSTYGQQIANSIAGLHCTVPECVKQAFKKRYDAICAEVTEAQENEIAYQREIRGEWYASR